MSLIAALLLLLFIIPALAGSLRWIAVFTILALLPGAGLLAIYTTQTDPAARELFLGLGTLAIIGALLGTVARVLSLRAARHGLHRPKSLVIELVTVGLGWAFLIAVGFFN